MKAVLLLSVLLAALLVGEARAEGAGQGGVDRAQTDKVVATLSDMFDACREIAEIYRPDCLSRELQRSAGKIANNPGYREAHVAPTRASRSMIGLVRQYADPDAGRLRVQGYRLIAVPGSALPALRGAGEDVMARAGRDLETLPPYERIVFAPIASLLRTDLPWP